MDQEQEQNQEQKDDQLPKQEDKKSGEQQNDKRKAHKAEKLPKREIKYDGFTLYAYSGQEFPEHMGWISQFCRKEENKWYSKIRHDFATDSFYYYGFQNYIPNLALTKELICDQHSVYWDYLPDEDIKALHDQAKQLYGLIHSKWICTRYGLSEMKRKIKDGRYGYCPRLMCKSNNLMPVGTTLVPNRHSVKLYCSCCSDIYKPPKKFRIDGAHFGPAFPAILLITIPDFDNRRFFKQYPFKVYGFDIYSKYQLPGPRDSNNYKDEEYEPNIEIEDDVSK